MAAEGARADRRLKAFLHAFDSGEKLIESAVMSIHEYYDSSVELIDSAAYRTRKGVRVLRGELCNDQGKVYQKFEQFYSASGKLESGTTTYEDGTVVETRR